MYSSFAVANAFIARAKDGKIEGLTPLKLQKLMFYAQSWYTKFHREDALFDEEFLRWQYGPVLRTLYNEFKVFGKSPINRFAISPSNDEEYVFIEFHVPKSDQDTWDFIDKIIEIYGHFTCSQLSYLSHQPDTAWKEGNGTLITKDEIAKQEFLKRS